MSNPNLSFLYFRNESIHGYRVIINYVYKSGWVGGSSNINYRNNPYLVKELTKGGLKSQMLANVLDRATYRKEIFPNLHFLLL